MLNFIFSIFFAITIFVTQASQSTSNDAAHVMNFLEQEIIFGAVDSTVTATDDGFYISLENADYFLDSMSFQRLKCDLENERYFGKGKWICTVAGAGKKSKCFKRP